MKLVSALSGLDRLANTGRISPPSRYGLSELSELLILRTEKQFHLISENVSTLDKQHQV